MSTPPPPGGPFAGPPPGWFPDPLGRYDHRWFNGRTWTADVALEGRRYVDPAPLSVGWGGAGPMPRPPEPSRTLAVLALVAGIVALTTAWMPFLVVLGVLAAVAALVLAAVARRRIARQMASGRTAGTVGLVLGVLALVVSPVGVILTRAAWHELERFAEPGRLRVELGACGPDGGGGTIQNRERDVRHYVVVVSLRDDRGHIDREYVRVDAVAPGEVRTWSFTGPARVEGSLSCRVSQVTGPYPFGLRPD